MSKKCWMSGKQCTKYWNWLLAGWKRAVLTLVLLNPDISCLANSIDSDQLASEEYNWSGSTLFVIKYVNFNQRPGSNNLVGLKLEVGLTSYIIYHNPILINVQVQGQHPHQQGLFWPKIFVREKIPFGQKQWEIFKFSEIFFSLARTNWVRFFFFFFFCKGQILYQNCMYKYYYCLFCNVF